MAKHTSFLGPYRPFLMLGGLILVVATLYWAEMIFIPLALAVLLTFILSPLVTLLQRRGLPRVLSALLVVLLALLILDGAGTGLVLQVRRLAGELPQYQDNIARKVAGVRMLGGGTWLQNLQDTFHQVLGETGPQSQPAQQPVPVSVQTSGFSQYESFIGPTATFLAVAGLVVVLVIFMLIKREDMRNRLVGLVAHSRLLATTRALTETAERLSRFLLMQLAVNAGYGVVLGFGLFLLGLPYAFLWGVLAAFLRYLPFVGTWLAMGLIMLFSVAFFPGWTQPLLILGLLVGVELAAANFVEPMLFGHSTGVSPLALLVAVLCWTWLWGPLGLVLSTPLTVCLVVLGRHVPNLEFLGVLLSDEPGLDPAAVYYQRLLARDQDEATDLVEEYVHTHPPDTVYDTMLVPALSLTKRDRESDALSPDDEQFIFRATHDILDDLAASRQQTPLASGETSAAEPPQSGQPPALVFGCPTRDEAGELALDMLGQLLDASICRLEVLSAKTLAGEVVSRVKQDRPAVVCIAALLPGGLAQAHYFCKRLRGQFPELKIVVGLWSVSAELDRLGERLRSNGADQVVLSLLEARDCLISLAQAVAQVPGKQTAV
jgi:predicted PurR-regulated permease PerM